MPSPRFFTIALLIFLVSFGVTMGASHLALNRPDSEFLTDDTRSHLRADYAPDGFVMRTAPTKQEIVDAAADDEAILLQVAPASQPSTHVQPNLIPTATPTPLPEATPTSTPARATVATSTPSSATPAPSATPPPLVTSTPPAQPTQQAQATPQPTSQPQPTPQPTVAVATPYVAPTNVPQPTPQPTVQQLAAPTATPYVPPTPYVAPTTFVPSTRTPTPFVFAPTPTPFVVAPPTATPFVFVPPSPTPFVFIPTATATRTPTPVIPTPTFTPVVPTATPIPGATSTPIPPATPTPLPTATAIPTSTPPPPTATATPTRTPVVPLTATPAIPSGNAWLLLHSNTVSGQIHRMSNAIDGNSGDHLDVNHGAADIYQTIQPIAWADGSTDWIVRFVMRDKPNGPAPATIKVWSQTSTCTDPGAVPAAQRYATGSVSIPNAVDRRGVAVGVTATGAPQHTFAPGEVLCLSILAAGGSGSDDLHYYGDTFSSSGLPGHSALYGPFSYAVAPYLLHQDTVGGDRSMSTSASGNVNDQVTINTGNTVTFQSTSPIKDASGLSPWPLHLVIKDALTLLAGGQAQVWKQTGGCSTYTSVPASQRFASGTFSIPVGPANNGVSITVPGTGAALTTFGPFEVLCAAISNTGILTNFTLRLDTPAANGTPGKTSLGGPFSQVAGLLAFGPGGQDEHTTPLLPLLAAWVVLTAGAGTWSRLMRRR